MSYRHCLQKTWSIRNNFVNLVPHRNMSVSGPEVIFEETNQKGVLTLNRPKALNSLNLNMTRMIYPTLKNWEKTMDLVITKGVGEKAFCAGGDVVSITKAGKEKSNIPKIFFKEEYQVNCLIGTLGIPYIAIIDGITMGGGVGLSVHGQFRVATERTLFAMPETAIGLLPDVGGSYFLPRLGGNLGTFLGLTGHRLKGRDVLKAGIATHFCDSSRIEELEKTLLKLNSPFAEDIANVLCHFQEQSQIDADKEFSLKPLLETISNCFQGDSVEQILENLQKEGSEFSLKQVAIIKKASPTALKVTLEALKRGQHKTLQEVLSMEYRLTQRFCEDNDFYEGVRAALIDKDGKPQWKPSQLKDVTQQTIDHYFSPLTSTPELTF